MKNIVCLILIFVSLTSAFADTNCDWSTIKKLPDGGFEYSPTLNLCVGNLVQDDAIKTQQIADYQKAVQLKDLALQNSDARVALWQTNADNSMDRLDKLQSEQKTSAWLYFGLGVLTTFAAGYVAAEAIKR